jgi:hypothetical protein
MNPTLLHTIASNKRIRTAFGLLAHLTKPATPHGMTRAKRDYLQKRYSAKLTEQSR